MVKYTGRGLVVKRPGVLSKVQMLTLVLGVGVFPLFQYILAKNVMFCPVLLQECPPTIKMPPKKCSWNRAKNACFNALLSPKKGKTVISARKRRPQTGRKAKHTMTYCFTITVLIHYLWRSPVNFPQENKVFQRPCRSVLLPSYCFANTVVN